jgi:hypothetical protein
MGLDISHGAFSAPYSNFARFRRTLWEAAGIELVDSQERPGERVPALWYDERFTIDNYMGEWELLPEDPLVALIVHSDCDGILPSAVLSFLAHRIEELVPKIDDEYQREQATEFIEGCRAAADAGEDLEFC